MRRDAFLKCPPLWCGATVAAGLSQVDMCIKIKGNVSLSIAGSVGRTAVRPYVSHPPAPSLGRTAVRPYVSHPPCAIPGAYSSTPLRLADSLTSAHTASAPSCRSVPVAPPRSQQRGQQQTQGESGACGSVVSHGAILLEGVKSLHGQLESAC